MHGPPSPNHCAGCVVVLANNLHNQNLVSQMEPPFHCAFVTEPALGHDSIASFERTRHQWMYRLWQILLLEPASGFIAERGPCQLVANGDQPLAARRARWSTLTFFGGGPRTSRSSHNASVVHGSPEPNSLIDRRPLTGQPKDPIGSGRSALLQPAAESAWETDPLRN